MGRWIAEICEHAVAQVLRDHAAKPLDVRGTAALKGAYDLPLLLWV